MLVQLGYAVLFKQEKVKTEDYPAEHAMAETVLPIYYQQMNMTMNAY